MVTVDQLHAQMKLAVDRRTFNRALFFKPHPKQAEFLAMGSQFSERLLMAGNRLGKSETGAFEIACHLTGDYPAGWQGRRFENPVNVWITGPGATSVRDIAQEKLCGPPGNPELFGSGMIPREKFVGRPVASRSATNGFESFQVRHSSGGISRCSVRTYEQERVNWQGVALDIVWFDEEPPVELYTEGRARLADRNGMSLMTFTPLFGMSDVVRRFMDEPDPHRAYMQMGLKDALHYSPERQAEILAGYPAHEREARANGDPLLGSGRIYTTPIVDLIIPPMSLDRVPLEWAKLWGIDFGIDHPFAAALLAFDRDEKVTYLLRTLRMTGAVVTQHTAAMRDIAGNVPVAWPHDGHQRGKGDGLALSKLYRDNGLNMLDTHATMPSGGYGLYGSVTALNEVMEARKFKVDERCTQFVTEYGQYHYKDGQIVSLHDDVLSAVRYGWMMRRRAQAVVLGRGRPKDRRRTEALPMNPWTGSPVFAPAQNPLTVGRR